MAKIFKFYKCQKGFHFLCTGVIGQKDNPLSMICNCDCHQEEAKQVVKDSAANKAFENETPSGTCK